MKLRLFSLFALFVFFTDVIAAPISRSQARDKALQFINSKKSESSARSTQRFGRSGGTGTALTMAEARESFYVFNIDSVGGYVIASGDDRMPDVLGYAYHGTYNAEDIPDNMRAWLQGYVEEYQYLQTCGDAKGASLTAVKGDVVQPLLECKWSQHFPYNDLCPKINGTNTSAGCVATAMAQVMYYHKWPKQTTKVIPAYTTKTTGISMPQIDIMTIDWDNIMPSYGYYGGTDVQNQAVAKLMLLCGCAVQMNYGLGGSDAYCSPAALTDCFGYNKLSISEVNRSKYSSDIWNQMIYDEVKEGRPVLYSGRTSNGGHQFVIDGYDENDYFHVNWGWGGAQDGYFLLGSLNGYDSEQRAIIGIQGEEDANHKYAYANLAGNTLTFYYDNKGETRTGTMFRVNGHEWTGDEYKSKITAVKFDSSFGDYRYLFSAGSMFRGMENLTSIQGLKYLNTQNVTDMSLMFSNCSKLTSLDVSNFNTQNVTSMGSMFEGCSSLTSLLGVSNFNTQNLTDMSWMFSICSKLTSLDVSSFDTRKVTNMSGMFYSCSKLTSLDVSNFDIRKVTNMSSMFSGCQSLKLLDVGNFDTQNVTEMAWMFDRCSNLASLDLSNFNTQKVTDMSWMFYNCSNLAYLDLSNFNTQKVTDMSLMFYNCSKLKLLDASKFDTQKVTDMSNMFYGCSSLKTIYAGEKWNTENVTNSVYMFASCSNLVGQDGTKYNYKYQDKVKAHYGAGGYLTYKSPVLRGDVNGDGKVDMDDATFVTNIILGTEVATKEADVNNDGIVSMPDVMFIVNKILNGKFPDE